jgi:hypothetical protein
MTNAELAATIAAVLPAAAFCCVYLLYRYAALSRSFRRYAQASWPEEEAQLAVQAAQRAALDELRAAAEKYTRVVQDEWRKTRRS